MAIVYSAPLPHVGWVPIKWGILSIRVSYWVSGDRGERRTDLKV